MKFTPEEEIIFSDRAENYCVCIIDMVNSTSVTAGMTNSNDVKKYYGIFNNLGDVTEGASRQVKDQS